jgi:predicted PurR-regulated permease PerM
MIFLAAIFGYWANGAVGAFIGLAIVLILNFEVSFWYVCPILFQWRPA